VAAKSGEATLAVDLGVYSRNRYAMQEFWLAAATKGNSVANGW
jgi:hypothetical protein